MTTDYYADWRDVPEKLWRWPNFSPEEIACRDDGTIRINEAALNKLQALRDRLGAPLIVNSAFRWRSACKIDSLSGEIGMQN